MLPYPDEIGHNNDELPVVDQSQIRGGFHQVADIAARNAFPTAKRKEGCLFNVLTPYSWYQLIGGVDNDKFIAVQIPRISGATDIEIYISATGNDTTGDGTVGNPYLTLSRAIDDVPEIVADILITFNFGAGTFVFADTEKLKLSQKSYSNVQIEFVGTMTTVEAGVSHTEIAANTMEYNSSKAGVTVTENQWRGMFVHDGDGRKYYPIAYNSAGTDNFAVTWMRGGRGGTRDIADIGTIFDMSSTSDTRILVMNFPGITNILWTKIEFNYPGEINFEYLQTVYEFDFAIRFNCEQVLAGGFNNIAITYMNFVGTAFITTDTVRAAFEQRDNMGQHSFVRCLLWTPNATNADYPVLEVQKQSHLKVRETAIIGNGVNNGIAGLSGGIISLSKTNIFYNVNAVVNNRYGNWQVQADYSSDFVNTLLRGATYLIKNTYGAANFQMDLWTYDADGSFVSVLQGNKKEYINPKYGQRIHIGGTYPEVQEQIEYTITNNTTGSIIVGDITENKMVTIDYYFTRGTNEGKGSMTLTNQAGVQLLENVGKGADPLVLFSKLISGNELRLEFDDQDAPDGNDTLLTYSITRKMILS